MADEYGIPEAPDAIHSLIDRDLVYGGDHQLDHHRKIRVCANCGLLTAELQKCARCRRVRYCSLQCQKLAWAVHRLDCYRRSTPSDDVLK